MKKPGLYAVTVSDTCGSGRAEILVREKNCYINFPNTFTPNKDGINDFFKFLTAYTLLDYHLSIYTRWGQKVFKSGEILTYQMNPFDQQKVNMDRLA